ncbi:hypothetical protein CRV03_01715 [Arcobacter sp. F155]|uniref:hypothetical protein n=1 Tax=Arcobacter sp. F155 TaxID=2044512 RepID=UPI00100B5317|nr:hypothetical protein [Arcobacter sp. F155]RXJ78770.1 hypothetical protein CRV03_01715 [Arcobacter sp. F155]
MKENYYWSDDLSCEFYIEAAKKGFITTSMYDKEEFVLLPEIQFDYAVLHFDDIKVPRKVKKLIKENNYILDISQNLEKVLDKINAYHPNSWLTQEYINILNNIKINSSLYDNFNLFSIELYEKNDKKLISGEIGYQIGSIYTSLSGFTTKNKKYNNWGKLQLVLLNDYLKSNNYKMWNLGHPQLQYKTDLGAKIYNRKEFLELWNKNK